MLSPTHSNEIGIAPLLILRLCAFAPLREISYLRGVHLSFGCVAFVAMLLVSVSSGCTGLLHHRGAIVQPLQNPLFIPPVDRELLWNQTVDAVDDYFRIEREDRIRLIGGVLTEGRIDTFPTIGSTIFEPWRVDSTRGYEKLHATLQSIRRRATVRVIPTEGGYLFDVVVQKELEDLDKPEHATAGGATLRHDGSIVRQEGPPGRYSVTLGWIPIGRDVTLEQRILADLSARLELHGQTGHLPELVEEVFSPEGEPSGPALRPAQPSSSVEGLPAPLRRLPQP
jgi:hypothetical protein